MSINAKMHVDLRVRLEWADPPATQHEQDLRERTEQVMEASLESLKPGIRLALMEIIKQGTFS